MLLKPSRMHVYADLKPYICTFEACPDMLSVFPSRKLWAEHEAINHFSDSFYQCHDCEKNFQEEAHFRIHLAESHYVSDLNHAQSLVIISAAKSSKVRAFTGQFCPLCKQTGWPTQRVYFTHLGKHLEQIALSALPPDPDSDSESEPSQADAASYRDDSGSTDKEERVTIKCICGSEEDDGNTVRCQICQIFQHIACFYPEKVPVPESHRCYDCSPRQLNAEAPRNYNILPPPSSRSFTPMNPPPSGFAPINPPVLSSSNTPVQANAKPMPGSLKVSQPPLHGLDNAFHNLPTNPPDRVPTPSSTAATGKRTPSATHPYTQSEAFNNRHHNCERLDVLNRGIWTSYGPGGTADNPTGPKVEMYLRCSHENCLRIDWRTVFGLQCHIVKNHKQPKGTIGSLEKALDRYGVPVSEIWEYERIHGPGSGGTMADSKNTKPKSEATPRTSEIMPPIFTLGNPRVQLPSETPTPPPAASAPDNLLFPRISQRTPNGGFLPSDIVYSDDDEDSFVVRDRFSFRNPPKRTRAGRFVKKTSISKSPASRFTRKGSDSEDKSGSLLVTAVTEVPPASDEKKENVGPSEDTGITSPSMGKMYNQAQRELHGNNDSGESDNEDCIVVRDRFRNPPKRTRAGRFVKKTSISESPTYRFTRAAISERLQK